MRGHVKALVLFWALCLPGCETPIGSAPDVAGVADTLPLMAPQEPAASAEPVQSMPERQTEPPPTLSAPEEANPNRSQPPRAERSGTATSAPAKRRSEAPAKASTERRAPRRPSSAAKTDQKAAVKVEHAPVESSAEAPSEETPAEETPAEPQRVALARPDDRRPAAPDASTTGSIPEVAERPVEMPPAIPAEQTPLVDPDEPSMPDELRSSLDAVPATTGPPVQAPTEAVPAAPLPGERTRAALPNPTPVREPVTGEACECPYDFAADGAPCGDKSLWTRSERAPPVCYADHWGETAVAACPTASAADPEGSSTQGFASFCSPSGSTAAARTIP